MPIPFLAAALVTAGFKALGTGLDIAGQRKAARNIEQEGAMEAELFGKNAEFAEEQATDAIARGHEAELRQRYKMRTTLGAQRAAFAGQGIKSSSGTAALSISGDLKLGEMDAMMIRENAAREAMGFHHQADTFRGQGDLARISARNRAKATKNQAWSSLANFGGDMFDLYQYGRRKG